MKKLQLKKEVIQKLDNDRQVIIKGGTDIIYGDSGGTNCHTCKQEDLPRTNGGVHIMRRITISGNSVRVPVSMVGFPPQSWDQRTQRLIGQRAIRPYFRQSLFI